jgi:hypothetical protein
MQFLREGRVFVTTDIIVRRKSWALISLWQSILANFFSFLTWIGGIFSLDEQQVWGWWAQKACALLQCQAVTRHGVTFRQLKDACKLWEKCCWSSTSNYVSVCLLALINFFTSSCVGLQGKRAVNMTITHTKCLSQSFISLPCTLCIFLACCSVINAEESVEWMFCMLQYTVNESGCSTSAFGHLQLWFRSICNCTYFMGNLENLYWLLCASSQHCVENVCCENA